MTCGMKNTPYTTCHDLRKVPSSSLGLLYGYMHIENMPSLADIIHQHQKEAQYIGASLLDVIYLIVIML